VAAGGARPGHLFYISSCPVLHARALSRQKISASKSEEMILHVMQHMQHPCKSTSPPHVHARPGLCHLLHVRTCLLASRGAHSSALRVLTASWHLARCPLLASQGGSLVERPRPQCCDETRQNYSQSQTRCCTRTGCLGLPSVPPACLTLARSVAKTRWTVAAPAPKAVCKPPPIRAGKWRHREVTENFCSREPTPICLR
jgi:hypothetical protein